MTNKKLKYIMIFLIIFILSMLIIFPAQMLAASISGLMLWFNIVLPSLFPFMVGVGLLTSLGASAILGSFLEPIMKPLFNVSGNAAFAYFMGILSGYPMGAKITAQLLSDNKISQTEAERILSFSNNPGILFILGTVATGMFKISSIGYFIIMITILSSITTGLVFRFYKLNTNGNSNKISSENIKITNMKIGTLLGENIKTSIETITQIGGFIILFSIIIEALKLTGAIEGLSTLIYNISPIPIAKEAVYGFVSGFLEMTNGASFLSNTTLPLSQKVSLTCTILSWGGLSIMSQTLSILSKSNIKTSVYFFSKALNGFFAFFYSILLYDFFNFTTEKAVPVFNIFQETAINRFVYSIFILTLTFIILYKIDKKNKLNT